MHLLARLVRDERCSGSFANRALSRAFTRFLAKLFKATRTKAEKQDAFSGPIKPIVIDRMIE